MTALVALDLTGIAEFIERTPFKRACSKCGGVATRLCDYRPGGKGISCDRLLCDSCTTTLQRGRDHCAQHALISKFRTEMHEQAQLLETQ